MLKKRQELEEQKFRLKQEELRLDLEAEIAKTAAKEQALAAIDGTALTRFSIYLASCRNAMKGSQYSSKFDQPDKIQRLVLKLPYNMRERWRWLVDDIMEL
ncbi:unnamed protein product [Pocillopora meandrina]|uniref:Uncharacterized protein n=1 Tax=Pocillopora meandrina TaxID=46732 RepID=A0AAU9WHC7_9CNID|nr:unnamed protein product [Pocillopora meandrina]